ncbi:hypothetical protein AMS68_000798 [Peltaster fructicola]|uniref:Uncharacterized protein n=1 Tax=Peltaster fructicola TaxID=286661 RepID=A0A6H0XKX3_9PEZI|nr:hypothetical protein AMS68_000798 [Peltaster fructicola]
MIQSGSGQAQMFEVIGIVASCVRAFNNGAEFVTRLQAKDKAGQVIGEPSFTAKELSLQELLQESLLEGGQAVSNHFKAEQTALGTHGHLLQTGDDIARQELLHTLVTLQGEILDKLGHDRENVSHSVADDLKSLQKTAIAIQHAAERSITELRQRLQADLPEAGSSQHDLHRRSSAGTMAASFVSDAVDFSKSIPRSGVERQPRGSINSLSTIKQERLIPEIRADDIDALSIYDDDRFTIAPERPYHAAGASSPTYAPQPRRPTRLLSSDAASMRAANAPESMPTQPVAPFEKAGPWFPSRSPSERHIDRTVPTLARARKDRPSVPESQASREMPLASRVLSERSLPSPSSSPRISEPDSAISIGLHSTKPYCSGAVAAQEDFIAGFLREFLSILPGSDKRELCWKCRECDFNSPDGAGELFERIEFSLGIRYRFRFLAKSHVHYTHPKGALKPRYRYACLFCTAEGKQSAAWPSVDDLMSHISDKHHTNLTPGVKDKTKCIVGRVAERDEEWDCNFPDVSTKKSGLRNFMIRAITSLPT